MRVKDGRKCERKTGRKKRGEEMLEKGGERDEACQRKTEG